MVIHNINRDKFIKPLEQYIKIFTETDWLSEFDALIGNNDRHFYNWAVIRSINSEERPIFSPIYDSARGLFWNDSEEKIKDIYYDRNRIKAYIGKYSEGSTPKIGWEGISKLNHFDLLERIKSLPIVINCYTMKYVCSEETLHDSLNMIDRDFTGLLSTERKALIKMCLEYRHDRIKKILTFTS